LFPQAVFLSNPSVLMLFTLAVKKTASEKADLYWPLALAALKNTSANSSRTATIELLCTSGSRVVLMTY
jgi:hypothetical protein